MADRAGPGHEKLAHQAAGPLVVAAQRAFHGGDRVVVIHGELHGPPRPARLQGHLPPHRLAVQHDVAFVRGQRPVRHIQPDPELAGAVHGQPAPAGVPRQDRAFLDGLVRIGDERAGVDLVPLPQAVARRAGAVGVERERFRAGVLEARAAHGAHDLHGLRCDRRPDEMAVRAQMRAEPRHHQPQDVQDLGHGPDRAARPGYRRALPQRQRGRQVADLIDVRPLRLREPPPAVGAQALQEPVHALGVEGADGQRRLA